MGKIKHKRQTYHIKSDNNTASVNVIDSTEIAAPFPAQNVSWELPTDSTGVFSKLNIDVDMLTKQLSSNDDNNFDKMSAVTSKSMRGLGLSKKDKKKLRHEVWLKKINIIESTLKEAKEKKKRSETKVVGDMKPMQDALPRLEEWLTKKPKKANIRKPRSVEKTNVIKKQMVENVQLFKSILSHPAYQADPLSVLKEHLDNKSKLENSMELDS